MSAEKGDEIQVEEEKQTNDGERAAESAERISEKKSKAFSNGM